MKRLALLCTLCSLGAAEPPKIFYVKSFPRSVPAYTAIELDKTGAAVYKEAEDDPQPLQFQLEPAETEQIFTLAEKLGYFSRPLESGLKVADMGMKTFRYQDGATRNEAKFNYSLEPDAQTLLDWFERLAETVLHRINLERTARFDRLGVDKALIQLQVTVERNRLAGARQLLPVLDRIAKNGVYMNRARERAGAIAQFIRAGAPQAVPAQ